MENLFAKWNVYRGWKAILNLWHKHRHGDVHTLCIEYVFTDQCQLQVDQRLRLRGMGLSLHLTNMWVLACVLALQVAVPAWVHPLAQCCSVLEVFSPPHRQDYCVREFLWYPSRWIKHVCIVQTPTTTSSSIWSLQRCIRSKFLICYCNSTNPESSRMRHLSGALCPSPSPALLPKAGPWVLPF